MIFGHSCRIMDMKKNSLIIRLNLSFRIVDTFPDIIIQLDNKIVLEGLQRNECLELTIDKQLCPGSHLLTIDFKNKKYSECTKNKDMAVIVDQVKLQHLPDDFKIYSWYQPQYPKDWLKDHPNSEPEIHSNYLGWNGRWGFDFETPIYAWCHRKMNLGWSL
jgi:hypothetical protein